MLAGANPTLQSDIYALGVTLFELTFGKLPIALTGTTVAQWKLIHESNDPIFPTPWPSHLPEKWRQILERMLNKHPNQRYQTYESLISDLKRIQPESTVTARLFPRLVAAGVDWISVLFVTGFVQFAIVSGSLTFFNAHPAFVTLVTIVEFLPIVAYMILAYFWRHSIGR